MNDWNKLSDKTTIDGIIEKLKAANITAFYVETGSKAKDKVLELIPKNSRVLASSSKTLEKIGVSDAIDKSDGYVSVRNEYMSFDHKSEADKIRVVRSTPDYIVGSVHAVTKKGEVMIASNTGSQLAAYVGGAGKVIWVVGTQKVVENLDEGFKRIYDYVLPLESERLKSVYGVPSNVSKLLIYDKETDPTRVTIIFVNESLGF